MYKDQIPIYDQPQSPENLTDWKRLHKAVKLVKAMEHDKYLEPKFSCAFGNLASKIKEKYAG